MKKAYKIAIALTVLSILVAFILYQLVLYPSYAKDYSISQVCSNPQAFNNFHVRLQGYVMHTSYMFGPAFVLRNFNYDGAEIAIAGKGQTIVNGFNLTQYVSFEQDDSGEMTQVNNTKVIVVGHIRYWGVRTDAPTFDLDIEDVSRQNL
jgi:hypothetical protein